MPREAVGFYTDEQGRKRPITPKSKRGYTAKQKIIVKKYDMRPAQMKKAVAQYEAIRLLGQTNMLRKHMVQRIAFENNFHELVVVIQEDYAGFLSNYGELRKMINKEDIPQAKRIRSKGWELAE